MSAFTNNTNRNNKRKSPPETTATLQSYNHWVAQLSATAAATNTNHDSTSTTTTTTTLMSPPRFPPPSQRHHQHPHLQPHYQQQPHGRIMTQQQQQQQFRGMAVTTNHHPQPQPQQQQYPQLFTSNTTNPQLQQPQHLGAPAAVYAPPTITTTVVDGNNAASTNNTTNTAIIHPSFSYLSITTNNNHQNNTTTNNKHHGLPPPPPHHHHLHHPPQALTAQQIAALRALNGGNEPSAFQIVEFLNLVNTNGGVGVNGGVGGVNGVTTTTVNGGEMLRGAANGGGVSNVGYINHTNYLSLGGSTENELSSVAATATTTTDGSNAAAAAVGGVTKKQRIPQPPPQQHTPPPPQPQQHPLNLFTTGTTLSNYNSKIPTSSGIQPIKSKIVLSNITRRILNECTYLCLLPNEGFIMEQQQQQQSRKEEEGRGRRVNNTKLKSTNQWLRSVVTLVYSLLNLESPNPVGWNDDDTDDDDDKSTTTTTTTTTPDAEDDDWIIKGIQSKLHGPQPWQCTRPFIANAVYQLLESEGYTNWLTSDHRWKAMEVMVRPVILRSLIAWKPHVFGCQEEGSSGVTVLVERYSKFIWEKFRLERLGTIVDCNEALVPPRIEFVYICQVACSSCSDWKEIILERKNKSSSAAVAVAAAAEVVELVADDNDNGGGGEENDDRMDTTSTSVEVSPDSVPLCLPVGQEGGGGGANDGNFQWESKWNCDYCSASFLNYDQATIHETECKAKKKKKKKSQAAAAAAEEEAENSGNNNVVVENNDVEYAIEEKWKCDHCTESFPTYDEAVAHENDCQAKKKKKSSQAAEAEVVIDDESKSQEIISETVQQQHHDGGNNVVENSVEYALEEKWECEHCSASFPTYDEAVAHENECKAKKSHAATEVVIDDDDSKVVEESSPGTKESNNGEAADVAHVNECQATSSLTAAKAAKDNDSKSRESPAMKACNDGDVGHENDCQAEPLTVETAKDDDDSKSRERAETKESNDDDVMHVNECQAKSLTAEAAVHDEARESLETKESNNGDVTHQNGSQSKSQAVEAVIDDDESKPKTSPETKESKDGEADIDVESNVEDVLEDKWKCDYCSASFSVYDEAIAHENECKTKSEAAEEAAIDDESEAKTSLETKEINDGEADVEVENNTENVIEEKWKCDSCSASFSVYDEAIAHENECKAEPQEVVEKKVDEILGMNEIIDEAANQSSVEGGGGFILEEKWKCDYCPASFSVYDEAVAHENECKAKMQSAAAADATTDVEFQSNDECVEKRVEDAMEEQWQCDYCKARFSVFDEAAAHEAECKRLSEAATSLPENSSIPERDAEILPGHSEILDVESGTEFFTSNELRSSMLQTLELLHYEYFPLMSGGDEKLGEVCEKVLKCMHSVTPLTNGNVAISKREVERVLNHLEHQSGYLSSLNGLFRVRVNTTALLDDSSPMSPAQAVRCMSSEPEDTEEVVVTYGLNSDGDQVIMAASSPEEVAASSRMPQSIVTDISDRSKPCGECILCNAPDCERCYACLSRGQTESDICIPPRQILSLAGLVMRRPLSVACPTPRYQYFHSFQAAFSVVQHKDIRGAANLVESFLSHVHGSDAMISYPEHFLVGRRFCFEFTNINGMNVAMFGIISTCFRESSEAETYIFMIQYDSDCIEIALKSLGTNISPLQLISSEQAWGGCISFERKARIHGRQSVVRSIDQATSVEYWVTPDMRMEEMVEQEDGIKVPMLTILLRGYKFVFSAHNDDEGIAVSVSCAPMNGDNGNKEKSILKPGELIDLGVFCPLLDSDTKTLPVFMLKNYIHGFSIDSFAGDGNGNVYDLTDDRKGTMHIAAEIKVLSYVRSCNETEVPTVHGGLDPSGKVHLLFGVRYRGDWEEYSSIMTSEIQPVFRGEQREVNLARNLMLNDQEGKYWSAMTNLGPEEIMRCAEFVGSLFIESPPVVLSIGMRERILKAANCLRHRISELGDSRLNVADQLIQHTVDLVQASRQEHNNNN